MAQKEHFTNGRSLAFGTGLTLVGFAFGAQLGHWQHWIIIGIGYGVGFEATLLATILITRSFYSKPVRASGQEKLNVANSAGDDNKGPQIATAGNAIFGDSAIRELARVIRDEKPAPIVVETSQPVSRFAWRYNSEAFGVSNGIWRTNASMGWQGISATITSVMPTKGERGKVHEGLVASITFWTIDEKECASVARAYWIGKRENDIDIDSGQSAKLVLLCFEGDVDLKRLEWVAYSNPYMSEEVNSDWGPYTLNLGDKIAVPVSGFPTVQVSIMNRYTREVIDSRRLRITISDGVWRAEELS